MDQRHGEGEGVRCSPPPPGPAPHAPQVSPPPTAQLPLPQVHGPDNANFFWPCDFYIHRRDGTKEPGDLKALEQVHLSARGVWPWAIPPDFGFLSGFSNFRSGLRIPLRTPNSAPDSEFPSDLGFTSGSRISLRSSDFAADLGFRGGFQISPWMSASFSSTQVDATDLLRNAFSNDYHRVMARVSHALRGSRIHRLQPENANLPFKVGMRVMVRIQTKKAQPAGGEEDGGGIANRRIAFGILVFFRKLHSLLVWVE